MTLQDLVEITGTISVGAVILIVLFMLADLFRGPGD